jgi:hypothetical protein
LRLIAKRLMEDETLDSEEFVALFADDDTFSPGPAAEGNVTSGDSSSEDSPPQMVPPSTAPLPA